MTDKPPKQLSTASVPTAEPLTLRQQAEAKKAALLAVQEQFKRQLDGIANQIYVINELLNPTPVEPDQPSEPDQPPEPEPLSPGTI